MSFLSVNTFNRGIFAFVSSQLKEINGLVDLKSMDPKSFILVKGARVHNLKSIDVAIPRDKFVVITGLSGSGKSSLAFETLYAEGQRRYVESLSSYARQFLGRFEKPDVDWIQGISPAVAIEQKVNTRNPRSTVGTSTEIYDYLKLLFARIGRTFSPVSGSEVKRHSVEDVVDWLGQQGNGKEFVVAAPMVKDGKRNLEEVLQIRQQQGFSRIWVDGEAKRMEGYEGKPKSPWPDLVIGRLKLEGDDWPSVAADYVQTAFYEGGGIVHLLPMGIREPAPVVFSNSFEADGIFFEPPSTALFSFNNPFGACKTCEGFGKVLGIDEDLVIPNRSLSVYEGAVACWKGETLSSWQEAFMRVAPDYGFPIHTAYEDLTEVQKKVLWDGAKEINGIWDFFSFVEENMYKIQYRVLMSRYRGQTTCGDCKGTRLRKDASYVMVGGKSIMDLVLMTIVDVAHFFEHLELREHEEKTARRLLREIRDRLHFLKEVGLGYLTLNRLSGSLSGGESQRINLATSLGSSLVGSMYILDEPSIGLHPRDTERLIGVVERLREEGNTVLVVEHDEAFMRRADHLLDLGPEAGSEGGYLVASGSPKEVMEAGKGYTAAYLNGTMQLAIPSSKRNWKQRVVVERASEHNLKDLTVEFPLGIMTVVAGVSGSGKTTLVKRILYPALKKYYGGHAGATGKFGKLSGDLDGLSDVELVDQNPIGKSSRSNPVTYIKAYDEIRNLYAGLSLSKSRGYKPAHFSFNVAGGRCEMCEGEGIVRVEMQFMADLELECEACKGKRFKEELLEVSYEGKHISDVLEMTIDEALIFFQKEGKASPLDKRIIKKLLPLQEVGLGYVKMGQSSSTLSGGEAQRVKLAFFLSKGQQEGKKLFLFDEPTTGLHTHDVGRLLKAFDALVNQGHSLLVIEHNISVMNYADWLIELGPEGGPEGGYLLFSGPPEALKTGPMGSVTSKYL